MLLPACRQAKGSATRDGDNELTNHFVVINGGTQLFQ